MCLFLFGEDGHLIQFQGVAFFDAIRILRPKAEPCSNTRAITCHNANWPSRCEPSAYAYILVGTPEKRQNTRQTNTTRLYKHHFQGELPLESRMRENRT